MLKSRSKIECLFGYHKFDEVWASGMTNLKVCSSCRRVGRCSWTLLDWKDKPVDILNETTHEFYIECIDYFRYRYRLSKSRNEKFKLTGYVRATS